MARLRSRPRPVVLSVITRLARGGSERRLHDVVAAVDADHVVVAGPGSNPAVVAELATRVEVLTCDALVRQVAPAADARALAWLADVVRRRQVDVVHTHQSKAGLLGRLATVGPGRPVVYHSASMASFGPGYGRLEGSAFALAERATAPLVDRWFVVGEDLRRMLAANGAPPERLQVVRSSLDLAPFAPPGDVERWSWRARLGVPAEGPVVAFVGALETRKGVRALPGVAGAVASALGRPVTLLVAGDGPEREDLAGGLAAAPDVVPRILGHLVDVVDVAGVMRAADALVLPSSSEGLPQVLVQAAACGLPVAAYDVEGVRELASLGASVAIAPLGDEAALAVALGGVLGDDRPVRRRLVSDRVLDQWDPATVAEAYRSAYRADLSGRRGGG